MQSTYNYGNLAAAAVEDDPAGGTALFFRETVPRNIVRGRFKGAVEHVEVKLWFADAHAAAAWLREGLEAAERAAAAGDMGYRHLRCEVVVLDCRCEQGRLGSNLDAPIEAHDHHVTCPECTDGKMPLDKLGES